MTAAGSISGEEAEKSWLFQASEGRVPSPHFACHPIKFLVCGVFRQKLCCGPTCLQEKRPFCRFRLLSRNLLQP